jgi:hypothetical protein
MDIWHNEDRRDAIKESISWYLCSNDSARIIDAGIILTQAAIDRLCFAYFIENRNPPMSKTKFGGLHALGRFRLLCDDLCIPQGIPSTLSKIVGLSNDFEGWDAPEALLRFHDELVHPQMEGRVRFGDATFEAWNLGLWYMEMVLLRLCRYEGRYSNRLKLNREAPENVPWAP